MFFYIYLFFMLWLLPDAASTHHFAVFGGAGRMMNINVWNQFSFIKLQNLSLDPCFFNIGKLGSEVVFNGLQKGT